MSLQKLKWYYLLRALRVTHSYEGNNSAVKQNSDGENPSGGKKWCLTKFEALHVEFRNQSDMVCTRYDLSGVMMPFSRYNRCNQEHLSWPERRWNTKRFRYLMPLSVKLQTSIRSILVEMGQTLCNSLTEFFKVFDF